MNKQREIIGGTFLRVWTTGLIVWTILLCMFSLYQNPADEIEHDEIAQAKSTQTVQQIRQVVYLEATDFATDQGEEIRFRAGDYSWADRVVATVAGEPAASRAIDAVAALGKPDYERDNEIAGEEKYIALGHGGELIVEFVDNVLVDGEGPDLAIFEIGPAIEPLLVSISSDGENWIEVGEVEGATATIDIASFIEVGTKFRFVRLIDGSAGKSNISPHRGADVDAIGAMNMEVAVPLSDTPLSDTPLSDTRPSDTPLSDQT